MYQQLFDKAQRGMNVILIFMVFIFTCAIAVRMIVRAKLVNSNKSRASKQALENLASVIVVGVSGIAMLLVLGRMK